MSKQPEEIPEDEIEEGEIVSDEEDEISMTEDEEVVDFDDEEDEDEEDEGLDIASLMTSLMATPDGDTVCSALVMIGHQLQTQNKILIKILSELKSA